MRAAVFQRYGPPGVIEFSDVPQPVPGPCDLLVEVYATSVNPLDCKIRRGDLRWLTGRGHPRKKILGFDVAGVVKEAGVNTRLFHKGDRVFAFLGTRGGANAEYIVVPEHYAAVMPSGFSFAEAASVPLAALTALQGLRDKGKAGEGQHVLINGASGGVGIFAVQIAKAFGANVTAVTSGRNRELVESLCADSVIDYTVEDFTNHSGIYDIIFDVAAKRSFRECRDTLRPSGIYITTVPGPALVLRSFLSMISPGKRAAFIMVKPSGKDLNLIREMIDAGKVRPVIDRIFPFPELAAAHAYAEEGHSRGKNLVLLRPDAAVDSGLDLKN